MSINNLLNLFPDKYLISFIINKERRVSLSNTEDKDFKEKIEISKGIHDISIEYVGSVDVKRLEKEVVELISSINPLEMLEIFSKNLIHDMKGPSNLSISAMNLERDGKISKDQMLNILEKNMDELNNSIDTNKVLIGHESKDIISKDELKERLEKICKNYSDVDFNTSLDFERVNRSILEVLVLLFQNLLSDYSGKAKVTIKGNENEDIKISISLDENIKEKIIESLILFRNKDMFHSLGFLRFASNDIFVRENIIVCLH